MLYFLFYLILFENTQKLATCLVKNNNKVRVFRFNELTDIVVRTDALIFVVLMYIYKIMANEFVKYDDTRLNDKKYY